MSDVKSMEPVVLAKNLVETSSRVKGSVFSEFLDYAFLRDCLLFLSKLNVRVEVFGGYPYAVRRILGVNSELPKSDGIPLILLRDGTVSPQFEFPVSAVEVRAAMPEKRISPKQLKISAAALAIPEHAIGDCVSFGVRAICFVLSEYADGLKSGLPVVGGVPAIARIADAGEHSAFAPPDESVVVASNRIDAALSGIFRISREDSRLAVRNGMANLNYEIASKPSAEVKTGDIIEVETRGRARIVALEATAKDRLRVIFSRY